MTIEDLARVYLARCTPVTSTAEEWATRVTERVTALTADAVGVRCSASRHVASPGRPDDPRVSQPRTASASSASLPPEPASFPEITGVEYAALRDDVAVRGVLVPVEVCAVTGEVLDGRARVRACTELGITRYPRVVRAGLLTAEDRAAHSRALNLLRRHLSPEDRAKHVRALRSVGWSTRRIAGSTGASQSTVVRDLRAVPAAGESSGSPDPVGDAVLGADGKTYPVRRRSASVTVETAREVDRAAAALVALGEQAPGRGLDLRRAERLVRDAAAVARRPGPGPVLPDGARVEHAACAALDVDPGSVDLVLTDPPYTVDSLDAYTDLGRLAARVLRPGGLLITYAGQLHLPEVMTRLAEQLDWWWMVAAVHDVGSGVGQIRQRGLGCGWKPLLVYRQPGGDRLPPWMLDTLTVGARAKASGHPWEQPEAEASTLITALTAPGDVVLDPFCGSGTVPAAAIRAGRRVIAGDVDEASVRMTVERLAAIPLT